MDSDNRRESAVSLEASSIYRSKISGEKIQDFDAELYDFSEEKDVRKIKLISTMTFLLLLPFQNCGQSTSANSGSSTAKISNSANSDSQSASACTERQTDQFSDSNGTNFFTLSRPTTVPTSIFVTVNGLISQSYTYDAQTVSVQVYDYSALVAQSKTLPSAVSITYCNQ